MKIEHIKHIDKLSLLEKKRPMTWESKHFGIPKILVRISPMPGIASLGVGLEAVQKNHRAIVIFERKIIQIYPNNQEFMSTWPCFLIEGSTQKSDTQSAWFDSHLFRRETRKGDGRALTKRFPRILNIK